MCDIILFFILFYIILYYITHRFDRMNTISDYVTFQRAFIQHYSYTQFFQHLIAYALLHTFCYYYYYYYYELDLHQSLLHTLSSILPMELWICKTNVLVISLEIMTLYWMNQFPEYRSDLPEISFPLWGMME